MARSITARAAARGFPVYDFAGQSGQGALPDSTLPSGSPPGVPAGAWTDPNTDPASIPAALPVPQEYQLGLTLWGLAGAANPDNTPRTHAAPIADPAQLAIGEGDDLHSAVFTGVAERHSPGELAVLRETRVKGSGSGPTNLETAISRSMRGQAGLDAVQGYGGGGPGPGGVNEPQGPVTDQQEFAGETYTNVFVSAAEVPRIVVAADQFILASPDMPAYMPTYDAPTASVSAQQAIGTDTPNQGPPVGAGMPAYAASFWG